MLPALEDLDLLGGVSNVRTKGLGPAITFRERLSDRHQDCALRAPTG
jgi:hypothetical protein